MNQTLTNDLTRGPVRRQLLLFACPIMLANLLQTVYGLVDMMIVGKAVGSVGLSAVGIGSMITTVFLTVGQCTASAGQIVISQQIGAGDQKGLNSTIGTLFSLLAIVGVIFGAVCVIFARPILDLMNTPAAALSEARDYVLVCGAGMLFVYGYNAVSSILRGMGESRLPLIIIGIASVLNVILDWLFVMEFGMRTLGAALATVIAQTLSCVLALIWLYRHKVAFGFDFKLHSFAIIPRKLRVIVMLAIPYVVQGLMITLSMSFINSRINAYDVTASAVDAVGQKLDNMLYIVSGAFATASAAMIGQCFGAGEHKRIESIYRNGMAICMAVFVVVSVVLLALPKQIFGLFSNDSDVIAMAPQFMLITVLFFLSASSMVSPFAVVEGIGYAKLGLIISLLDGVVARIGFSLILEHFFSVYGLWIGSSAAGLVTTIISMIYYHSKRWKKRKVLISMDEAEGSSDQSAAP